MKKLHSHYPTTIKAINVETRSLTAIASTDSRDRHGDRVMQGGWDLAEFKANPVIIANHDYKAEKVVAKATRIEVVEGKLEMDIQFSEDTQLAKDIFNLFKNGFLNAFSVGFMPTEASYETETDEEGNSESVYIVRAAKLLEVSAVAIPANPDALSKALKSGETTEESAKIIKDTLGADFDKAEKQADLDKLLKIFSENHEVLKSYRKLASQICKRLEIEAGEDEQETVDKLLKSLKLILPNESKKELESVETPPAPVTSVETPPTKRLSNEALEKLLS